MTVININTHKDFKSVTHAELTSRISWDRMKEIQYNKNMLMSRLLDACYTVKCDAFNSPDDKD